jgi:uncharacterized protein involved in exopolysaccharide biosynthesis
VYHTKSSAGAAPGCGVVRKAQEMLVSPTNDSDNAQSGDITISEATRRIRRRWVAVLVCTIVGLICGALTAFLLKREYLGEVTLVPQGHESGGQLESIAKRVSGLASVAGINIGSGSGQSNDRDVALATLSSYELVAGFIEREGIRDAFQKAQNSSWSSLWGHKPLSVWETVQAFKKRYDVTEERTSSVIHVRVTWSDPVEASRWANGIVEYADQTLRGRSLQTSQNRLEYLTKVFNDTSVVAVREAVSTIMESEVRSIAIAKADKQFAFYVIDSAIPAERPVRPQRALICVAFASVGLLGGIAWAVGRSG